MPVKPIPTLLRQLIYKCFADGKSTQTTMDALFCGPNATRTVSSKYLGRLWTKFADPSFVKIYLYGPVNPSGRPRMLDDIQNDLACDLAEGSHNKRKASRISTTVNTAYHGENSGVAAPSARTILRTLKRGRVFKKVAERKNVRRSDYDGLMHLEKFEHLNYLNFIDTDITVTNDEDLLIKKGWQWSIHHGFWTKYILTE